MAGGSADWVLIYAPGAGSSIADPFGAYLAAALADEGVASLRFQFPYMEAGRRVPDREPTLEATWLAAIETARAGGGRLVIGGRSMGGRVASQIVAQGTMVDALVLFAYPLHPPGRPDRARINHLPRIAVPTLFCSGTNDAFASPVEIGSAVAMVPGATLHLLDAADHGFVVRKASGRTREQVWQEAAAAFLEWLRTL